MILFHFLNKPRIRRRVYKVIERKIEVNKLTQTESMCNIIKREMKLEVEAVKKSKQYKSGIALEYKSARSVVFESLAQTRSRQKHYYPSRRYVVITRILAAWWVMRLHPNCHCGMFGKTKLQRQNKSDTMEELRIEQYIQEHKSGA